MIEKINDRDIRVKKVEIFPLEVIVRNITTGSFCKRLGAPEGLVLDEPIFEMSYKNDEYGDPLINDDHAVALKLATREELAYIKATTLKINELLKQFFLSMNLKLVDFKIEFGKTKKAKSYWQMKFLLIVVVYGTLILIKNMIKMSLDKILVI